MTSAWPDDVNRPRPLKRQRLSDVGVMTRRVVNRHPRTWKRIWEYVPCT